MRTHASSAARRPLPGQWFATEAEAWDWAARLADESTTYAAEPCSGGYVLNAYDETGHWLGRL